MSEANKEIVRRNYEEFNKRNFDAIDELYAPDFVGRWTGMPELHGPQELKQFLQGYIAAFPDIHNSILDMVAEGDKVTVRERYRGTHKGDFQGIPATGKEADFTAIDIYRIVNGKIVEAVGEFDSLGFMQKLGVIPTQS